MIDVERDHLKVEIGVMLFVLKNEKSQSVAIPGLETYYAQASAHRSTVSQG